MKNFYKFAINALCIIFVILLAVTSIITAAVMIPKFTNLLNTGTYHDPTS